MPNSPNIKAETTKGQKLAPKVQKAAQSKSKLPPVAFVKIEHNTTFASTRDSMGAKAEYDLDLIESAIDVEAIVARIIDRMRAVSWKNGWYIKVPDSRVAEYIDKRLLEMYLIQMQDFESVLKTAYKHLVMYGSAFIVKIRDTDRSSGKEHKMFGKDLQPIAGLEVVDPTTMSPIRKTKKGASHGRVIGWQQVIFQQELKNFPLEDVMHITFNKKASHIFGTPFITPVLDDIRSLRRLEELTDIGVVKSVFPLIHYKVGTENRPPEEYENGDSEVARVRNNLNRANPEDMIISPGTHSIEAVKIDGAYLDTSDIRKHYVERIVTGMGASLIDIGLSGAATKDTANNISQNLLDLMTDVQNTFSKAIDQLLLELVLEAQRYDLSKNIIPSFHFETIDWEAQHKAETHLLSLMNAGAITIDEFRIATGRHALSEQEYKNTAIMKYQQSAETNGVQNKANPENQSGKRGSAAKKTTRKDTMPVIRPIPEGIRLASKVYEDSKSDIARFVKIAKASEASESKTAILELNKYLDDISKTLTDTVSPSITQAMNYAANDFGAEHGKEVNYQLSLFPFFQSAVKETFDKLVKDIQSEAQRVISLKDADPSDISIFMNANKYRIDFIVRTEINAIRNNTFAKLAREHGYKNVYWDKRSSCEQCKSKSSVVDVSNIEYNDIRALVPNCGDMLRLYHGNSVSSSGYTKFPCRG